MKIYTQRQLAELEDCTVQTIVTRHKKGKYQILKTFDCLDHYSTFYLPKGRIVRVGEEIELVNPCWVKQGKGLDVIINGKERSYALPEDCKIMK